MHQGVSVGESDLKIKSCLFAHGISGDSVE